MANAEIKAVITADDRASSVLAGVGNSFSKLLKLTAVGATVAAGAAVAFGVSSVKAYSEAEKASKQLEHAVVGVTKASKEQLAQTEQLADALEKKGVLDADNIKMGLAQLSTFGLSNKAVQDLGGSLADLAVNQYGVNATGEQLNDTANMIAKALNGQFGVLEKSGIRFTKAQKAMIQYGTEAEKVTAINEGFAQNLKYTNDVALTTTEGKLAKLSVAFENIKENIGKTLVDALTPLATSLSNFVASDQFKAWVEELNKWLAVNIPIAIAWVKDVGLPALKNAFDLLWPVVKTLVGWMIELVNFLADHQYVFWGFVAVLGAIKVAMALQGALAAFKGVIAGVTLVYKGFTLLLASPLALPAIGVAAALASLAAVYAAIQSIKTAINDVNNAAAAADRLAPEGQMRELQAQATAARARGDTAAATRYANAIRAMGGGGARALGGNVQAGTPYTVGEQGKEMFIPSQSGRIIPNHDLQASSGNISVNVNVGMYAGSEMEKRKVAEALFEALKDVAGSKNTTVARMMGA